MSETKGCIGVGRVLGHDYFPCYDVAEAAHPATLGGSVTLDYVRADEAKALLVLTNRTFKGAVCRRCGALLERP